MKIGKYKVTSLGLLLMALFYSTPLGVSALEISRFSDVPVKNDILLSPAKVEVSLDPGTKSTRYINVVNRMGQEAIFEVGVEDFSPSEEPGGGVVLDKTIDGLNSSLKKYISLDKKAFTLSHGEQARIPITISLPKNINSGGLYGAVLVSGAPLKNEPGATKVITRLGSLFFVKVNGYVKQSGNLKTPYFRDNKIEMMFENDGDIYLNPYGFINLNDFYSNKLVSRINVDPWFVLPKSIRSRTIAINDLPEGKYVANISINRGYNDIVDIRGLSFEITSSEDKISRKFWLSLIIIFLILLLYKYFFYAKNRF